MSVVNMLSRRCAPVLAALLMLVLAAPGFANTRAAVYSVMKLDSPLVAGEYAWDDSVAPAGPTWIVVDVATERIFVYRGGVEIGRSFILYGADEKPTPLGTFPILQKKVEHYSNLYDGAPMPYMQRLTWGGVAIHASEMVEGYATHGCIGVPDEFAQLLYRATRIGDRVTITRNWMRDIYG